MGQGSGNFYGTSREQVNKELAAGSDIVLEVDVRGRQRQNSFPMQ